MGKIGNGESKGACRLCGKFSTFSTRDMPVFYSP